MAGGATTAVAEDAEGPAEPELAVLALPNATGAAEAGGATLDDGTGVALTEGAVVGRLRVTTRLEGTIS